MTARRSPHRHKRHRRSGGGPFREITQRIARPDGETLVLSCGHTKDRTVVAPAGQRTIQCKRCIAASDPAP